MRDPALLPCPCGTTPAVHRITMIHEAFGAGDRHTALLCGPCAEAIGQALGAVLARRQAARQRRIEALERELVQLRGSIRR